MLPDTPSARQYGPECLLYAAFGQQIGRQAANLTVVPDRRHAADECGRGTTRRRARTYSVGPELMMITIVNASYLKLPDRRSAGTTDRDANTRVPILIFRVNFAVGYFQRSYLTAPSASSLYVYKSRVTVLS